MLVPALPHPLHGQCFSETLGDGATPHSTHLREPTVPCGYNQEHAVPNKPCSVYSLFKGREACKANILAYTKQLCFKLPVEPDLQDQGMLLMHSCSFGASSLQQVLAVFPVASALVFTSSSLGPVLPSKSILVSKPIR